MSQRLAANLNDQLSRETPDTELFQRFLSGRDPRAFAAIVARYGPMVRGVCRRQLACPADADDAFQATFVALADQARRLREPAALGGWLHRVAMRISTRLRTVKRPTVPLDPTAPEIARAEPDRTWADELRILDAELARLPEALRGPLILCYFDGLTRDEAARRLGTSLGTLKRRLEAGRRELHARLLRRGVGGAVLAAVATGSAGLNAHVPGAFAREAVQGALGNRSSALTALAEAAAPSVLRTRAVLAIGLIACLAVGSTTVPASGLKDGDPKPVAKAPREPDELEPPLPAGAIERIGSMRFRFTTLGHLEGLSPDGSAMIVRHGYQALLCATRTGRQISAFGMPHYQDGRLTFDPSGRALWFGRRDGDMVPIVADVQSGKILTQESANSRSSVEKPYVAEVRFSRDGREAFATVASWHDDGSTSCISVFDTKTWRLKRRIDEPFRIGEISPAANRYFATRWTERVRPKPSKDRLELLSLDRPPEPPRRAILMLGDLTTKAIVSSHESQFTSLPRACFSNDGSRMAVLGPGQLLLIDPRSGKIIHTIPTKGIGDTHGLFSPDGSRLATFEFGHVHLIDTNTGRVVAEHVAGPPLGERERHFFTGIAFTSDGKRLFASRGKYGTSSFTGAIRAFDGLTGREREPLAGKSLGVERFFVTPDDKQVIAECDFEGSIRRWDLSTCQPILPPDGYKSINQVSLSLTPDGRDLVLTDESGRVDIWNIATRTLRPKAMQFDCAVIGTRFSADGQRLQARHYGDDMRAWGPSLEFATGKPVPTPEAEKTQHDYESAKAGDGSVRITFSRQNNELCWRDGKSGGIVRQETVPGHRADATDVTPQTVTFTPNGRRAIVFHADRTIRIWDVWSGRILHTLPQRPSAYFSDPAVTRDGHWFIFQEYKNVTVREIESGQVVLTLGGHSMPARSGVLLDRDRTLATSVGPEVLIWALRPPTDELPTGPMERLWDDLRGPDAARAYRAVWALAERPGESLAFLRDKLPPVRVAEDRAARKAVADLAEIDDIGQLWETRGAVRAAGKAAVPYLRTEVRQGSAARRTRVGELLFEIAPRWTAEELSHARAVHVVERIGTPEAYKLLADWAAGSPGFVLTDEAGAAVQRRPR